MKEFNQKALPDDDQQFEKRLMSFGVDEETKNTVLAEISELSRNGKRNQMKIKDCKRKRNHFRMSQPPVLKQKEENQQKQTLEKSHLMCDDDRGKRQRKVIEFVW